jgi:DNA-binding MarR family transcriptional regulator
MSAVAKPSSDHDCTPCDSVDRLVASWREKRPELEMSSVEVVTRLGRVRDHIDERLATVFANFGLTTPAFAALVTLARLNDDGPGVSQRRLADELGLTPGTVSVRVDRLAEQGLLTRTPDPELRRNVLITLTDKGRELFERAVPAHLDNEARLLAALDDDEQRLLAALLRKLLVEFEGSTNPADAGPHLGLLLVPAHVTIEMRESVGLPRVAGLLVHSVEPGSPAHAAGIAPGDVLIRAGARELRSSSSLYAAIQHAGERLTVTLLRGNEQLRVRIALNRGDDAPVTGPTTGAHAV